MELLVVIAIIALLAAILFPVFAQAKEAAKKAACLGNVKQVSLAWTLYAGEYDDNMCMVSYLDAYDQDSPDGVRREWWASADQTGYSTMSNIDMTKGTLQPFMKNVPILDCPSRPLNTLAPYNLGYGMNLWLAKSQTERADGTWQMNSVNYSEVELPADTILFADSAGYTPATGVIGPSSTLHFTSAFTQKFHGRHSGKGNIGWLDGHAKSMTPIYHSRQVISGAFNITEKLKQANIDFIVPKAIQYLNPPPSTSLTFSTADKFYYLLSKSG